MITVKIDNKIINVKPFKTSCFGAYEFAWIKIDSKEFKLRRRIGSKKPFVIYDKFA